MKTKKRILYYDMLNIAACIAVIALHHNGLVHVFTGDSVWKECLAAEVGFYWAVPVFLMLSGATLMGYREKYSTRVFFKKRLMRVVLPWLFWSVFFLIWKTANGQLTWENYSIKEVINSILSCRVEDVYWFFPVIIGMYLFMPFLSMAAKDEYRKVLWYVVIYGIIVNGTIPVLCAMTGLQWNGAFNMPLGDYYIFVILGYLLSTTEIPKKWRIGIYITGICCALIRYGGVYLLSMRDGAKNTLLFGYGQFHSFGLAVTVFVLFKYIKWDRIFSAGMKKLISQIAGCSLGIYLIHKQVMQTELNLLHFQESQLVWRTGGIILTYLIALVIVLTVKRIPVVKRVFP